MEVLVASQNPVKLAAVHAALRQAFPEKMCVVHGIAVPSGVSDQPMSDAHTYLGAKQRAQNAQQAQPEAQLWMGIEGGVEWQHGHLHAFAWVYVIGTDRIGEARTASFILPKPIAELVQDGMELGEADDRIFGTHNSKQQQGAIGLLTHGRITRETLYTPAILMALIPFMRHDLYE